MTAEETRVRGAHQALTPVVDVARDPRWGRVEETYRRRSVSQCAAWRLRRARISRRRVFKDKKSFIATLKHFVAHGQPESGMNCAPANVRCASVRESFLFPFKEAIAKRRRDQCHGQLQRD